jgi:hypothetical protein
VDFNGWDQRAVNRVLKLPVCIQPYVKFNDPYFCTLPVGWTELVINLHNNLVQVVPDYELHQVKEKFGGLRYYTSIKYNANSIPSILIQHYEEKSFRVCAECGTESNVSTKTIKGFYVCTMCDDCRAKKDG